MSQLKWHKRDVEVLIMHVSGCQCVVFRESGTLYTSSVIDSRCIGGYLTPDPREKGVTSHEHE